MAIVKKFDPNRIYISKKLEGRLKNIYDYPVTIAEAPVGYGKTTSVKEYLKSQARPYIWFNIDSENKKKTFDDFCIKLKGIDEAAASRLAGLGYPAGERDVKQAVAIINSIVYNEATAFVVDNYHYVADVYLDEIIKDLSGSAGENIHIVIITQAVNPEREFELVMNKRINYLSKKDFELDREDITSYYKSSGIKLEERETDFLYKYTEGWISALYLQMLSLASEQTFELTTDMERLMEKALWNKLDSVSRDFLIAISIFDSFTLRQCVYMARGTVSQKQIEHILSASGFISCAHKEGKYFMHSLLKYFLEGEFEKMENSFKKNVIKRAGNWYRDNEDYLRAIEYYYKNRDYRAMLSMRFPVDVLYELRLKSGSRQLFIDVTTDTAKKLKSRYIKTYMLFVYFLFLDNAREYYDRECSLVLKLIGEEYAASSDYESLMGEYYVLECFKHFNDIEKMKESLEKAYGLLKRPSKILGGKASLLLGCPSPFGLYHTSLKKSEEECKDMEELMPVFYRITDGESRGAEALFKAEALLMQGELEDAMKLCGKAVYMARSNEQSEVYIGTLMCISRISYLRGDREALKSSMDRIAKLWQANQVMGDLCIGFVEAAVNNIDKIPAWLKDPSSIERKTDISSLGFANIIYGKYLLMSEAYDGFLSISGQMLKAGERYDNVLYKIYILIYMAAAKDRTGDRKKAAAMLKESMELGAADKLFIPFVENFYFISGLFKEIEREEPLSDFAKGVTKLSEKYIKGMQNITKLSAKDNKYGMTKREMEVARLAAGRLSNREIAEQLFIAESTVKSNLKVIYNKLGINSRNELKNFF